MNGQETGSFDVDVVDDLAYAGYVLTAAKTQLPLIERLYPSMKSRRSVHDFNRHVSQRPHPTLA